MPLRTLCNDINSCGIFDMYCILDMPKRLDMSLCDEKRNLYHIEFGIAEYIEFSERKYIELAQANISTKIPIKA